jgi:hypothetical protein
MTPEVAEVTFGKRGFPAASSERLELIPEAVVCGFEWGMVARSQWDVERRLKMVDAELRGFACEGVTMAFTILDAAGQGHRTRDFLLGSASRHILLACIGMGFAMARLPRPLWRNVLAVGRFASHRQADLWRSRSRDSSHRRHREPARLRAVEAEHSRSPGRKQEGCPDLNRSDRWEGPQMGALTVNSALTAAALAERSVRPLCERPRNSASPSPMERSPQTARRTGAVASPRSYGA